MDVLATHSLNLLAKPIRRAGRKHRSTAAHTVPRMRSNSMSSTVDEAELDRILGTVWTAIERCFRPALRIGFASRFGA